MTTETILHCGIVEMRVGGKKLITVVSDVDELLLYQKIERKAESGVDVQLLEVFCKAINSRIRKAEPIASPVIEPEPVETPPVEETKQPTYVEGV